jgi:hypothetical protein
MSANFLNKSGVCAGVDAHTFVMVGPLGAPLPVPLIPHVVADAHFFQSREWRIAHSVTTDHWAVLQSNWAMIVVSHVFITPPGLPHPAGEPVMLAAIIATSSAAPQLTAHSVTAEGGALCTEIISALGANLDCSDFPAICLSADLNLSTVKTSPTLGDYVSAIVSAWFSIGYSWVPGAPIGKKWPGKNLLELVKQALASLTVALLQTVLDILNAVLSDLSSWPGDPVAVGIGKLAALIQVLIDGVGGKGHGPGH